MNPDEETEARGTEAESRPQITEDWLRSVGFKWSQFDRQQSKHWLLWIGGAILDPDGGRNMFSGCEDLGVEIASTTYPRESWSCFFRADTAGRYHRFIHLRYMRYQDEVVALVESLTGRPWNPENHIYGSIQAPEVVARWKEEERKRPDRLINQHPWTEAYKDPDRSKPLLEHVDAAIKGGLAK